MCCALSQDVVFLHLGGEGVRLFRPLSMQTGGRPSPSGTGGVHDRILSPLAAVQLHLHHHAGHIRGSDEVRPSGAVGRGRRLSGSVQSIRYCWTTENVYFLIHFPAFRWCVQPTSARYEYCCLQTSTPPRSTPPATGRLGSRSRWTR